MTRRNWTELKEQYATTSISLRDLAREAQVPLGSLTKAARRENWVQARRLCGDTAVTKAVTLAADAVAKAGLPERSAALKERIVTQLERDTTQVEKTEPMSLDDSEQRQAVLGSVVRNAEVVLEWGSPRPSPAVSINVLSSFQVSSAAEPALPALPAAIDIDVIPPSPAA